MRTQLLLIALFLTCVSTVKAFVAAIPIEELRSATRSKDGFYVQIVDGIAPAETRERGGVPQVTLDLHVPLHVGKTYLGLVFLEIEGDQGQTILAALLDGRKHGNEKWYWVTAERRQMRNCVVHFEYKARPNDTLMVKDYVVRLKYHTPTQKDVDQINRQLRN